MIRKIRLYGSLEKIANQKEFRFDCDDQYQLFAGLKFVCPALDVFMRGKQFSIVTTESDEEINPKAVQDGFHFSGKANVIHISPPTEGAWWYVAVLVISMVVSYAIVRLTMPHTGSNGAGGTRSTMFNGPVNSTDQGTPIPIIYGKKVLVGSQIIAVDEDYYNIL